MKRLIYLGVGFALMGVGGTMWTSCSDIEAGDELVAPATESAISIGNFPTYSNDQTRAVDGTPTDDKTAWADGDLIYLQITPKDATATWYTLEFEDGKWVPTETLPTLQATDEWKAVYAPNYEVTTSSGSTTSLSLISGKTNASAEYLTCAGTGKPIAIAFERTYARLRIYCGARDVKVNGWIAPYVLIDGFLPSDAEQMMNVEAYFMQTISPDELGNFYLYGSWSENHIMELQVPSSVFQGDAAKYIYCGIPNGSVQLSASVANTTYAVDYESVTVDLDKAPINAFNDSDFSSDWVKTYTNANFTQFRVIGTWSSNKALAFANTSVTRVDMSNVLGLTEIPDWMCYQCTSLQSFKFPANVTTIGSGAFYYCSNLTVDALPETLQTINMYAFGGDSYRSGCTMTISTLPSGLQSVGDYAFRQTMFPESFTFRWPATLPEIPFAAFEGSSLSAIEIPEGVTTILSRALALTSLTAITLPSTIETIDCSAFNGCSQLSSVTCLAATPPSLDPTDQDSKDVFLDIASNATLFVPAESVGAYKISDWAQYFTAIQAIPTTTE